MKTTHGFEVVEVGRQTSNSGADQRIWSVHPPIQFDYDYEKEKNTQISDHVMTSAVTAFLAPETYIFPCTKDGIALKWGELPGSFQGGLDHIEAIMGLNHEGHYDN